MFLKRKGIWYDVLRNAWIWLVGRYIACKCQVFIEEGIKMLVVICISWFRDLDDVSFFMISLNIWLFRFIYAAATFTWSNNLTAKQGDNYNVRSIKLKGAVTTTSCISKSKHFAAGTEKGIVSNLLFVQNILRCFLSVCQPLGTV